MKRKITFMMLAIAMLSITGCKASPKGEQICRGFGCHMKSRIK